MLFFNFAWKPMPPFWDCLKILMGTFTIFWLSWTDSFRIQQIDSFRFLGQIFTPVGNSAMEIPKWIGSSDIDCITHLQYDKLWGLPRRVFTLFHIRYIYYTHVQHNTHYTESHTHRLSTLNPCCRWQCVKHVEQYMYTTICTIHIYHTYYTYIAYM